ncbi:MAG: hypothetical protein K6C95_07810 [Lachnospiraceae bacterium]|nr:hypothetical protein [Lachnospiraceae bacterium]
MGNIAEEEKQEMYEVNPNWARKLVRTTGRWSVLHQVGRGLMRGTGNVLSSDSFRESVSSAVVPDPGNLKSVTVDGHTYTPDSTNLKERAKRGGIGVGVNAGMKIGSEVLLHEGNKEDFLVSGKEMARYLRSEKPDEDKIAALETETGYRLDGEKLAKSISDKLVNALGDSQFYPETWQTQIMPDLLRTAFIDVIRDMNADLVRQAKEKKLSSTELLELNIETSTAHIRDIFEDYTLAIANQTEALAAPMRFTDRSPDLIARINPGEFTDETEKQRLESVKKNLKQEILTSDDELVSIRNEAMKDFIAIPSYRLGEEFLENINKAVVNRKDDQGLLGPETPEFRRAVLDLREVKKRYESRSWWNRNVSDRTAARKEKDTLDRMSDVMKKFYPRDAEVLMNAESYVKRGEIDSKSIYQLPDIASNKTFIQQVQKKVSNESDRIVGPTITYALEQTGNFFISIPRAIWGVGKRLLGIGTTETAQTEQHDTESAERKPAERHEESTQHDQSGRKSEQTVAKAMTEEKPEDKPQASVEEKAKDKPQASVEEKAKDKPQTMTEEKPEDKPEATVEERAKDKPEVTTEEKPKDKPEDKTEVKTEDDVTKGSGKTDAVSTAEPEQEGWLSWGWRKLTEGYNYVTGSFKPDLGDMKLDLTDEDIASDLHMVNDDEPAMQTQDEKHKGEKKSLSDLETAEGIKKQDVSKTSGKAPAESKQASKQAATGQAIK